MCLYPKLIINKKYASTKKNGGNPPIITDQRTKYVPIGCQNCMECRKQKAMSWQVRLLEDIKTNTNGKFITLTFSNESIKKLNDEIQDLQGYQRDNQIATLAIRRFLERWRKQHKKSLRHWLVTEIGHQGTENIHLHGIIWTDAHMKKIKDTWQYGWIWEGKIINGKIINYVNEQTVNYITKYINKIDELHTTYRAKVLTSPGIGKNYTHGTDHKANIYNGKLTREYYKTRTGHKISMPIYWRNKIYTDNQREKLWLNRLDKQERWVNGEKVSVAKNYDAYNALLKWHQARNNQLGYGNDTINWEQKQYEKERRNLMIKTRIQNSKQKRTMIIDNNWEIDPETGEIFNWEAPSEGTPTNKDLLTSV